MRTTKEEPPQAPKKREQGKGSSIPDMDSHNGLRGVAAVWVVLFHLCSGPPYQFDFLGTTLMPLFFILSGFSLAVVYGQKPWKTMVGKGTKASCCRGGDEEAPPALMRGEEKVPNDQCKAFEWR